MRQRMLRHLIETAKARIVKAQHIRATAGNCLDEYAEGYLQAVEDMEDLLSHGMPRDPRGYWWPHK